MTGHKTEAVYRRYAIVSEQDLQEAAAKLAAVEASRVRPGQSSGQSGAVEPMKVGGDRRATARKVAEGEGFEPPRASRPGGFQVLATSPHYRRLSYVIVSLMRT